MDGRSTPRPIRFKDDLWTRFQGVASAHNRTAADHLRWMMQQAVELHEASRPRRKDRSKALREDESIIVDLEG